MNVAQLKAALSQLPDDMEVWMQKDPEGNGYSVAEGADIGIRVEGAEDIYDPNWDATDADMTEEEWEQTQETHPRVLVLWPTS